MATSLNYSDEESYLPIQNPSYSGSSPSSSDEDFQELQNEDVQPAPSETPQSSKLYAIHGSCLQPQCKKSLFSAVIHCCSDDKALAKKVRTQLEKMKLPYLEGEYSVTIAILGNITAKTELEELNEICEHEMTKVFFMLRTPNYEKDPSSQKVRMKIINILTKSKSSFDAIDLFSCDTLIRDKSQEPEFLKRVLYEPDAPEFQEEMRIILTGTSFHEQITLNEDRQRCEENRRRNLQRSLSVEQKNQKPFQTKASRPLVQQKKMKRSWDTVASESDSSLDLKVKQLSLTASRGVHKNNPSSSTKKSSSRNSRGVECGTTETSDDTSLSTSSGHRGDISGSGSDMEARKTGNAETETKLNETLKLHPDSGERRPEEEVHDRNVSSFLNLGTAEQLNYSDDRHNADTLPRDVEDLLLTFDTSYCAEHTQKHVNSHSQKKSMKSSEHKLQKDQPASSSSSASEQFRGNPMYREIKPSGPHPKQYFQQGRSEEESTPTSDQHMTNSYMSLSSDQEHILNDLTSAWNSKGSEKTHRTQTPASPSRNSCSRDYDKKRNTAVVEPMRRIIPNDNSEERNEETLRKVPYTVETSSEISNTFGGLTSDSPASQDLQTIHLSTIPDSSQLSFASCPSGAVETEESVTEINSAPAEDQVMTEETDEEEENEGIDEEDEEEEATRHLEQVGSGESGCSRRPTRSLPSRLLSRFRSLLCTSCRSTRPRSPQSE